MVKQRKGQTAKRVRDLIEFDPTISDAAIGRALGITRQAIHHHTRSLDVLRQRLHRSCAGCGVGIRRASRTGMCKKCLRRSYAYRLTCYQCGNESEVTGREATQRRYRKAVYGDDIQEFCNASCAGRYKANQAWDRRRAKRLGNRQEKIKKNWKEFSNGK